MNKSELLQWLQEEYRGWEGLLGQIRPEWMEQPGVNGDWTMKDMIAHLTGYQPRVNANLQAALRGEPEPPPPWPAHLQTDDEINAWIYETNRRRSLDQVLDESRRIVQQFLDLVKEFPEDVQIEQVHQGTRVYHLVWLNGQRYQPGELFDHFHDDHEPDIRAWLARRRNSSSGSGGGLQ